MGTILIHNTQRSGRAASKPFGTPPPQSITPNAEHVPRRTSLVGWQREHQLQYYCDLLCINLTQVMNELVHLFHGRKRLGVGVICTLVHGICTAPC